MIYIVLPLIRGKAGASKFAHSKARIRKARGRRKIVDPISAKRNSSENRRSKPQVSEVFYSVSIDL
jgi:hypothetical protein